MKWVRVRSFFCWPFDLKGALLLDRINPGWLSLALAITKQAQLDLRKAVTLARYVLWTKSDVLARAHDIARSIDDGRSYRERFQCGLRKAWQEVERGVRRYAAASRKAEFGTAVDYFTRSRMWHLTAACCGMDGSRLSPKIVKSLTLVQKAESDPRVRRLRERLGAKRSAGTDKATSEGMGENWRVALRR